MSNKFNTDTFHNFQIVRKSKDMKDDRHGVDWWTEHRAIATLKDIKFDERRASDWKHITDNTDIESMRVCINGSSDSGGIEEVYLYDGFSDEIHPKYQTLDFPLINHGVNLDEDIPDVHCYTNEGCKSYSFDSEGVDENRKDFQTYLGNGWDLYKAEKANTFSNPHFTNVHLCRQGPGNDGFWNDSSLFNLEFPSLTRYNHMVNGRVNSLNEFLDSLYYGVLPGGWEINEGSNNEITITSDEKGNPLLQINHHYYEERSNDYRLNTSRVIDYIKDNVKNKESKVFNLDTKKGSKEFYKFVNEINAIREA